MIGFGELRRFSLQRQVDLAAAEMSYVTDWVLKGIFDHTVLASAWVLRGAAALRYAYDPDYPGDATPEFLATTALEPDDIRRALREGLQSAAEASGLGLLLAGLERGRARIEYTGPLGRRSAAQPHLQLAIVPGQTRLPPVRAPLIHPFADACSATVSAVALEELIAERLAGMGQSPRARDVFDLWYAWQHGAGRIDLATTRALVHERVEATGAPLPTSERPLDPAHAAILARSWPAALSGVRSHPSLEQVQSDLARAVQILVG